MSVLLYTACLTVRVSALHHTECLTMRVSALLHTRISRVRCASGISPRRAIGGGCSTGITHKSPRSASR
eukprot:9646142-Alexandrium_andersonii.AAC.1